MPFVNIGPVQMVGSSPSFRAISCCLRENQPRWKNRREQGGWVCSVTFTYNRLMICSLLTSQKRFETREIAENVLAEFHNVSGKGGVKLLLRFADTKAQKLLKQQSNERRAYRAGEYNYSVEVVQGSTPSPTLHRLQQTSSHISPSSQLSYQSPIGVGPVWTPATSISPSYAYLL